MKESTRKEFSKILKGMASTYGVDSVERQFSVMPSKAQTLQDKIVEKSGFLPQINVVPVTDMQGENILGGLPGPISGRIDTSADKERVPRDVLNLSAYPYVLVQTNSDVCIRYVTLDSWAKFPNMFERFQRYTTERIANDRELVGWYGKSAAKNTDISKNPMLQDVNKGWIQYMRDNLPKNILETGKKKAGEIRVGKGGDFEGLDHAVSDLVTGIPLYLRKDLTVLIGDELILWEKQRLYKSISLSPKEKTSATQSLMSFGGVGDWQTPSNFPPRGLVITPTKNLSIYYQEESWRRHLKDKPEKDRWEDFNSRNEGYTVETPEAFVAWAFEKVKLEGEWATA